MSPRQRKSDARLQQVAQRARHAMVLLREEQQHTAEHAVGNVTTVEGLVFTSTARATKPAGKAKPKPAGKAKPKPAAARATKPSRKQPCIVLQAVVAPQQPQRLTTSVGFKLGHLLEDMKHARQAEANALSAADRELRAAARRAPPEPIEVVD